MSTERKAKQLTAMVMVLWAANSAAMAQIHGNVLKPGPSLHGPASKSAGALKPGTVRPAPPEIQRLKTAQGTLLRIGTDSVFDSDRATITPDGERLLGQIVAQLKGASGHPVVIECHTDGFGFESYTLKLSQSRAEGVALWLINHGALQAEQVAAKGFGRRKPLAAETEGGADLPDARRLNRRLEILIKSESLAEVLPAPAKAAENNALPASGADSLVEGNGAVGQAPSGQNTDWSAGSPDNSPVESATGNPIFDALPKQEDLQQRRSENGAGGTVHSDASVDEIIKSTPFGEERAKPPTQTQAEKEEHEWAVRQFGTWRD